MIEESEVDLERLRHETNHALHTVEWLYQIEKKPAPFLVASALLHDCDRFFKRRRPKNKFTDYISYKKEHSKNSAAIAGKILKSIGKSELAKKTAQIILLHEFGGTREADLIRDCDSLAFFDKNHLDYYLKTESKEKLAKKIKFMTDRMSIKAKQILKNIR